VNSPAAVGQGARRPARTRVGSGPRVWCGGQSYGVGTMA